MRIFADAISRRNRAALALITMLALVLASSVAVSAPGSAGDVSVIDDETVYVLMDATGAHRETIVVDWLQMEGTGDVALTDRGDVTGVEALKDDVEASIAGDEITWDLSLDGRRDFFYRAETNVSLPLEVEVVYTLDGSEIAPEDLAGREGHLRIDVTVRNIVPMTREITYLDASGASVIEDKDFWLPMLAPVQISLDGTRFNNIVEEADILSVTGTTMAYTFMAFPQDEQTISIEMDGSDIQVEPIIVSAFPTLPGGADFDFTQMFADIREGVDGLAQLSDGHAAVLDGVITGFAAFDTEGLASSAGQFGDLTVALGDLGDGTAGLEQLIGGQIAYLDGIIGGIDTSQFASIGELASGIESLTAGIEESRDGIDGMVALLNGQISFLDGLAVSNSGLTALAAAEAAGSGNATVTALAAGLATQDAMIAALRDGNGALGLDMGLTDTRDSLVEISDGLTQTISGLETITIEAQALTVIPDAFAQINGSLMVLRDGGVVPMPTPSGPVDTALPGMVDTLAGLQGVTSGLGQMESGLIGSSESLSALESMPAQIGELMATLGALRDGGKLQGQYLPGVTTSASGLREMASGLDEAVDGGRMGEALTGAMKSAAADYDTFLGKPEGAVGRVRFVMKLDGVGVDG